MINWITKKLLGDNPKQRFYLWTNAIFVITLLIASVVSLFHVMDFWMVTNSHGWAVALAIATGLGIIGSMMATKYTKWTYVSFFLIIIMELWGNIFSSFIYIDTSSESFEAWKMLMQPIFELIYMPAEGQAIPDIIYMRWVASIQGAFIPILVAIIFHMWMKISQTASTPTEEEKKPEEANNEQVEQLSGTTLTVSPTSELKSSKDIDLELDYTIIAREVDNFIKTVYDSEPELDMNVTGDTVTMTFKPPVPLDVVNLSGITVGVNDDGEVSVEDKKTTEEFIDEFKDLLSTDGVEDIGEEIRGTYVEKMENEKKKTSKSQKIKETVKRFLKPDKK